MKAHEENVLHNDHARFVVVDLKKDISNFLSMVF